MTYTTIGAALEDWNTRFQERRALKYKGVTYTYEELYRKSASFASYFATSGIVEGEAVVLMGKNSADWLFSFFGLQLLGAVPVPVNPSFTPRELGQIMEIVGAKVILYNEFQNVTARIRGLHALQRDYVLLPMDRGGQYSPLLQLTRKDDTKDVACILLTSGTTGIPKGVQLTHDNLLHNCTTTADVAGWCKDDIFLLTVPLFHCFGLTATTLCAFMLGAELTIVEPFQSSHILQSIDRDKVTIFNGVPTLFIVMMRHNDVSEYDLSTLRSGIIAGAPLTAKEYREIKIRFGFESLIQSYGQTETSPAVTMNRPGDSPTLYATSVGAPIPGCEVAIFDEDGNPVPPNHPGHIQVRGRNVMKGYINGERRYTERDWLCTGDVGLLDRDGNLYVSGRSKDIIIRGGENISAIEIQNVVKDLPYIEQARALAVRDEYMGEEICLHISLNEERDEKQTEDEIRDFIGEHLVRYKIPKYILFHDALPAGGTGKIDDRALSRRWKRYKKEHAL